MISFYLWREAKIFKVESRLKNQLLKLNYYKQYFEQQNDTALVERLAELASTTTTHLELIEKCVKDGVQLPDTECETLELRCIPINLDVKEKELKISIQAKNLDASDAQIYVISEFFFPPPSNETACEFCSRKLKEFKVQRLSIFTNCFSKRQVDKTYSSDRIPAQEKQVPTPVNDHNNIGNNDNSAPGNKTTIDKPQSYETILFEPALSFYIDKGRSKTFKRKFKPIKLTFFKSGCIYDDLLGTVQFKIDEVNDWCTLDLDAPLKRRLLAKGECSINAKVKVREALVEKEPRPIIEEILKLKQSAKPIIEPTS